MKRTWQPKKVKRLRQHGFLKRMANTDGAKIIRNRRAKGRHSLTVSIGKK